LWAYAYGAFGVVAFDGRVLRWPCALGLSFQALHVPDAHVQGVPAFAADSARQYQAMAPHDARRAELRAALVFMGFDVDGLLAKVAPEPAEKEVTGRGFEAGQLQFGPSFAAQPAQLGARPAQFAAEVAQLGPQPAQRAAEPALLKAEPVQPGAPLCVREARARRLEARGRRTSARVREQGGMEQRPEVARPEVQRPEVQRPWTVDQRPAAIGWADARGTVSLTVSPAWSVAWSLAGTVSFCDVLAALLVYHRVVVHACRYTVLPADFWHFGELGIALGDPWRADAGTRAHFRRMYAVGVARLPVFAAEVAGWLRDCKGLHGVAHSAAVRAFLDSLGLCGQAAEAATTLLTAHAAFSCTQYGDEATESCLFAYVLADDTRQAGHRLCQGSGPWPVSRPCQASGQRDADSPLMLAAYV
jgi:hypothetical protein